MANLGIKLPKQHYVTMQERSGASPLGFMTPYGTDSAAKKRMSTADNWGSTKIKPLIIDNEPCFGFKVQHSVDRSSRFSRNVVWRVEDPRGFELEIQSGNMESIISECIIEKGEIQSQLIWARDGNVNILVPIEADEYKEAVKNQQRVDKTVSLRDVDIGNTVILHNGEIGTYLGKYHTIELTNIESNAPSRRWGYTHDCELGISKNKKHWFYHNTNGDKIRMFNLSSPKISEITDKSILSIQEAEKMAMDYINTNDVGLYDCIGIIANKTMFDEIKLEEITEVSHTLAYVNNSRYKIIGVTNGQYGIVGYTYAMHNKKDLFIYSIDDEKIKDGTIIYNRTHRNISRFSYNSSSELIRISVSEKDKFYKLKYIITNPKTGNVINGIV